MKRVNTEKYFHEQIVSWACRISTKDTNYNLIIIRKPTGLKKEKEEEEEEKQ